MYHICRELSEQLKAKDEKILDQQKEIYELKLEKVEVSKQELQTRLNNLLWWVKILIKPTSKPTVLIIISEDKSVNKEKQLEFPF